MKFQTFTPGALLLAIGCAGKEPSKITFADPSAEVLGKDAFRLHAQVVNAAGNPLPENLLSHA